MTLLLLFYAVGEEVAKILEFPKYELNKKNLFLNFT